MTALVRYVGATVGRSLRWVAPFLVFVLCEVVLDSDVGDVLPTYALSAAALFFVATWLSVVVGNSESAVQEDVTVTAAGGRGRVRVAKLLVAYAGCLVLGGLGLVVPAVVTSGRVSVTDVVAGGIAQALTALFGVALGSLCTRPVVDRTSWAVLVGAVVGLADVAVPQAPPIRQLLALLGETSPRHLGVLLLAIALETAVLSVLMVACALRISATRA